MALYDAEGSSVGSSLGFGDPRVIFNLSGASYGDSAASGQFGINFILGGHSYGTSFTSGILVTDAEGFSQGTSLAISSDTVVIRSSSGHSYGTSTFTWSTPNTSYGTSSAAAHAVVERPSPPVNAKLCPPKTFTWLQLFQRGDLPLYLCDGQGGRIGAISVYFSLIRIRPDGTRQMVGPQNRIPAKGFVGEYYATGLAGELGQPGKWVIQWRYQVSPNGPTQTAEMPFVVTDAVSAPNPRSILERTSKFGWS